MAIIELTIIPIGTASTSLSQYVADIQQVLEQAPEPIHYQMTSMSTLIEGDLNDLFQIIHRLHEVPFTHGAERVSTSIKIDDRRDKQGSMAQKMRSVEGKMHK
ncbi:MTH1187 family thiamine-binding protein [Paenibacillus radicis (ex Xue et al. 2023)]|uniref:MTH1187 family thiamine-binding protein n=1 Tax=Paenibacillus radicis (ex Xue et al. 2023) TaxID=2972489 RepID=A0ABT1YSV0_9BACL|nr:MTH1187 family thiamine-binding protein [Paenibacillus radicis (ex Xue et al. 2023)]MCR8636264.1 MTH1187 family thiamine-binding protein [Paenibacillus radicis (ex Xue et al. 2023)]